MKEKLFIFSISEAEKRLINYLDWFAIGFIPFFPVLIVLFGFPVEKALYIGFSYAIIMIPIIVIYRIHHRKFAYKITFDLVKNVVVFDMLKRKGTQTFPMTEIGRITINYFISFNINGKKILYKYRDKSGKKLELFLDGKFKVEQRFFCRLFSCWKKL